MYIFLSELLLQGKVRKILLQGFCAIINMHTYCVKPYKIRVPQSAIKAIQFYIFHVSVLYFPFDLLTKIKLRYIATHSSKTRT